jgi:hypothetical protein
MTNWSNNSYFQTQVAHCTITKFYYKTFKAIWSFPQLVVYTFALKIGLRFNKVFFFKIHENNWFSYLKIFLNSIIIASLVRILWNHKCAHCHTKSSKAIPKAKQGRPTIWEDHVMITSKETPILISYRWLLQISW